MLNADIGKPTGPDPGEREERFFLTSHPLLEISAVGPRSRACPETFVVCDEVS